MESLETLFQEVAAKIKRYVPPLVALLETDRRLDVVSDKPTVIEGRKKDQVYFASVILYPTYVGFYFMPVYTETEVSMLFPAELLSLLKGKSCFHLKKSSPSLLQNIETALQKGYEVYREKGWIE
jgi:hypothetical protein